MKRALMLLLLAAGAQAGTFVGGGPATTDNDASCDIAQLPAATLLLPYFEVDIDSAAGTGENTIFTVTNASQEPQAVTVTLWTDWAYPVVSFNLFLTGYDMQSISLYDVIGRGLIGPSTGMGLDDSPVGEYSGTDPRTPYDNRRLDERSCARLVHRIDPAYVKLMQGAFTKGRVQLEAIPPWCNTAGGRHANAIGYATLDVVGKCTVLSPADPDYYTDVILFDNVLVGDYIQVNGDNDFAQGNPMVHIRAIPEGGTPAARMNDPRFRVNFPRTFYGRFQHASRPQFDARQPLPSTFVAHWIEGGVTGYETFFKIWREARTSTSSSCADHARFAFMDTAEMVRFDEEENPEVFRADYEVGNPLTNDPATPATGLFSSADQVYFPPRDRGSGQVAGWMYINLDDDERDAHASQNWVITSLRAEDRYSVDTDAAALGNGCGLPVPSTGHNERPIGPAPNVRP